MAAKILVVDDEALILTAVERALLKVGYRIWKAQTMKQLAECICAAPFDLLITDIYMEEESVENIIRIVRESSPGVRVMKMSGSVNQEPGMHFIEKPFSIEALRRQVREILDGPA